MNESNDGTFKLTRNSPYYQQENWNMIDNIDWNDTPDSNVVPTNLYALTVGEPKWEYSNDGKLQLSIPCRIDGPQLYKDAMLFPRFFIGTDDDPAADQPETWKKRGAQDLKKFLVGVFGEVGALTGNIVTDVAATQGAGVLCLIEHTIDQRVSVKNRATGEMEPNQYQGQEQNRFKKWFAPNDPEASARVGLMEVPTAKAGAPRPAAAPAAPAPRPPAAPPTAAAPAAPAAPSVPRTAPARAATPPAPPARPAAPPPPPRPQA